MAGHALWRELSKLGVAKTYESGAYLLHAGAPPGVVLCLVSGVCKIVTSTGDGRETLVAVRGAGEVVGELAALTGMERSASVIALTDVEVASVALSAFQDWLCCEPDASRFVAELTADRLVESTRRSAGVHQSVVVRLADRVLALMERFGDDDKMSRQDIPLTHDDFAAWVGATRSVTTRAFGILRSQGVIDFGRGWIEVHDPERLAEVCRDGQIEVRRVPAPAATVAPTDDAGVVVATSSSARLADPRILVVDDLPANIDLLEAVLEPEGFQVLAATSGEEALELLGTEPIDLVLLDLDMPGIDGLETCRRIRNDPATALLPVVIITATTGTARAAVLESGADDFVPKPMDRAEVLARIHSLLRIKRYQDEVAALNASLQRRVSDLLTEIQR